MATETVKESLLPKAAKDALASGGILSSLAAFIGASCCVLPLLLINIGLGGAWIANLAFFVNAKPFFLAASILFIVFAFTSAFWGERTPTRKTLMVLGIATLLTGVACVMPLYEAQVIRFIRG